MAAAARSQVSGLLGRFWPHMAQPLPSGSQGKEGSAGRESPQLLCHTPRDGSEHAEHPPEVMPQRARKTRVHCLPHLPSGLGRW